jgi:hypothetical protein
MLHRQARLPPWQICVAISPAVVAATVATEGQCHIVAFDHAQARKGPILENLRKRIEGLEERAK